MQIESIFNGSPTEFAVAVREFAFEGRDKDTPDQYYWYPAKTPIQPDANPQYVVLRPRDEAEVLPAMIVAHTLPENRARLLLRLTDENWELIEPWWIMLKAELDRQGWLADEAEHPNENADDDIYVPTRKNEREKYKRGYEIVVKLREEYHQLYLDGETDNPGPSNADLLEAIKAARISKVREKTLSRIIKAGDNNRLN